MIVLWRVTGRCNYACAFCAYDRRLPFAREDADPAAVERFGRVLGAHRRASGERVLLSWLGGEPLLWKPVHAVSQRLREEQGLTLSATTNGSTLGRPEAVAAVLRAFDELTVSVDGFAPFHDATRGSPHAWARVRAGVLALAAARTGPDALRLRANVVLMRDNLEAFAELCGALADWGIDEITFNALGGRDRPEFFPAHALRASDVLRLRGQLPVLRAQLATRGVRLCGAESYLARLDAAAQQQAWPVADCAPGEEFLFVDEAGRVAPCGVTTGEYAVPVAEITDVAALRALPARYRAARAHGRAAACADCPSTRVSGKFGG
jgi:MoaA/NifB/PqqE/SkfB family radical SAM enzyme